MAIFKHKKLIALMAPVALMAGMGMTSQAVAMKHGMAGNPYAQDSSKSVVTAKSGCVLTRGGVKMTLEQCGDMVDGDADGDGVKDSKDKCPGTPKGAPVDASGCPLDSDGDGVPDYLDKCPGTPKGARVDRNGCEIKAMKEPMKVVLDSAVLFDFDSADIRMDATDVLDRTYAKFANNPDVKAVVITGHTDSIGSDEYNMDLSVRRANSVRDYMIGAGADASMLSARGMGESKPVASNATKEGRQQNRRVEFNAVMK